MLKVLPKVLKSNTDTLDPRRTCEKIDTPDPIRAMFLMLNVDPRWQKSRAETAEPQRW
jgi:hypothetical protein